MASTEQRSRLAASPVLSESSSFAQTGAEFNLDTDDSSDDDDLRSAVLNGGPAAEAYELQDRSSSNDHEDGRWDADDGGDERMPLGRRPSASTVASFQLYTPDEELAVRRKFDRKLVLFVALLFMLSFLDRSSTSHLQYEGSPDQF